MKCAFPEHFLYTSEHQWVWARQGLVRIGLTDFAQGKLGAVVFVDLSATGTILNAGDSFGLVETVKVAIELLAPLCGRIVVVNTALQERPGLINEDPYGAGWLCEITPSRQEHLAGLWTAERYREHMASSVPPIRR